MAAVRLWSRSDIMRRKQNGNVLILFVFMICSLTAVFICFAKLSSIIIMNQRHRTAVEAASLAAAGDLSRIVIDDPYFGFVALTDYPPVGKATIAGDGEPLPVSGINTVIGTARLDWIIANRIGSPELCDLALKEVLEASRAARRLSEQLRQSLKSNCRLVLRDADGELIKPYEHAKEVYFKNLRNLPANCKPKKFEIQLGWLDGGSTTNTSMADRHDASIARTEFGDNGKYCAFVDTPANGESFYFAGLGAEPSLVVEREFRHDDGHRLCSIVRISAEISIGKVPSSQDEESKQSYPLPQKKHSETKLETGLVVRSNGSTLLESEQIICSEACAQPFYTVDTAPPTVLVLDFPDGLATDIRSIRDLLTGEQLSKSRIEPLRASGGDFPDTAGSQLVTLERNNASNVRREFAKGFLNWMKTAHCKPRIDSILNEVNRTFTPKIESNSGQLRCMCYTFDRKGNTVAIAPPANPFPRRTIYDGQSCVLAFDAVVSAGATWSVSLRDQTSAIGVENGGKHAGQPMPSPIANWLSLAAQPDQDQDLLNWTSPSRWVAVNNLPSSSQMLTSPMRSNYLPGRLSFEFQLSGPMGAAL